MINQGSSGSRSPLGFDATPEIREKILFVNIYVDPENRQGDAAPLLKWYCDMRISDI